MEDGRGTIQGRGYNFTFECDSELRLGLNCGSALAAASTPFYSWFCLELLFWEVLLCVWEGSGPARVTRVMAIVMVPPIYEAVWLSQSISAAVLQNK